MTYRRPAVRDARFVWPEAAVATLKRRLGEGWSASLIARDLEREYRVPITRNGVLGKIARMRLATNGAPTLTAPPRPLFQWTAELDETLLRTKSRQPLLATAKEMRLSLRVTKDRLAVLANMGRVPGRVTTAHTRTHRLPSGAGAAIVAYTHPAPASDAPSGPGVGFFELRPCHCRWPLWGTGKPTVDRQFYCGEPIVAGSWCQAHLQVAMPPPGHRFARAA